jgi:hypothetical protein
MILSDMVDLVCTTISQTEATDRTACKMYFKLRWKMLWALAMFKDSLVSYTQTISSEGYDATASTWLPTRRILLVHPLITHVVAARTDGQKLSVQSPELFYCRDLDVFNNQGALADFILLPPRVWSFDTAQSLVIAASSESDAGSVAIVDTVESDGITEDSTSVSLSTDNAALGSILDIEAVSKVSGSGSVQIGTLTEAALVFTVTYIAPLEVLGVTVNSLNPADVVATFNQNDSQAISVSLGDVIRFVYDGIMAGTSYTVVGAGTLTVTAAGAYSFAATADTLNAIITLGATDTVASKRQRIQLIGGYANGTVLRVLGKRTCPRLTNDNDEPTIPGAELCLIPAVHADMLKKERQYGKAIAMVEKEFGPMLETLMKEQTVQQANKKRLVPVDGFGGANAFRGGGCSGFPF